MRFLFYLIAFAQFAPFAEAAKWRNYFGFGMVGGGGTEYIIKSTSGSDAFSETYSHNSTFHFNYGLTRMFRDDLGVDLALQFGSIKVNEMKGGDTRWTLLIAPRYEIPVGDKIRVWGSAGLGINQISINTWYNDGNLKIYPDDPSGLILGFAQGLGVHYQLSDKYYLDLSTTHQFFKISDQTADLYSTTPLASGKVKGQTGFNLWATFLTFGYYLDWDL